MRGWIAAIQFEKLFWIDGKYSIWPKMAKTGFRQSPRNKKKTTRLSYIGSDCNLAKMTFPTPEATNNPKTIHNFQSVDASLWEQCCCCSSSSSLSCSTEDSQLCSSYSRERPCGKSGETRSSPLLHPLSLSSLAERDDVSRSNGRRCKRSLLSSLLCCPLAVSSSSEVVPWCRTSDQLRMRRKSSERLLWSPPGIILVKPSRCYWTFRDFEVKQSVYIMSTWKKLLTKKVMSENINFV